MKIGELGCVCSRGEIGDIYPLISLLSEDGIKRVEAIRNY